MFGSAIIAQRVAPDLGPISVLAPSGRYYLSWDSGNSLSVSATGKSYAYGRLKLVAGSSSFAIIIEAMSMQQYLYGLGEMPSSWHSEALRSQAIAGRSFAGYRLAHPQSSEFDMYASVSDQAYVGYNHNSSTTGANWTAAVTPPRTRCSRFRGAVIQAFYSSSNGGHTERSDYVFSATLPYLVATPDPFDQATGNSNFSWSRTYTGDELGTWLKNSGRNVGVVTALSIGGNVGASGRTDRATVTATGTTGSTTLTGNQFRSAVNAGAASSHGPAEHEVRGNSRATAAGSAVDATAPDLKMLNANPMRFGFDGRRRLRVERRGGDHRHPHPPEGRRPRRTASAAWGPTSHSSCASTSRRSCVPTKATNVTLTRRST